ncbi:hypothetical protein ACLI4Y_13165 [Natrialbaceae archaeon A-CW3]
MECGKELELPEKVTTYITPENPPHEPSETEKWIKTLKHFEGVDQHFVYVLECQRRKEYSGLSPDDIWGHPDFEKPDPPNNCEFVTQGDLLPVADACARFHYWVVHPPGYPELSIPLWLYLVISAKKVYYVGETPQIAKRYKEHMNRETTQLFRFFEPTGQISHLYECLPHHPGDIERKVSYQLSSLGGQDYSYQLPVGGPPDWSPMDWTEVEAFAYRGVSGTLVNRED